MLWGWRVASLAAVVAVGLGGFCPSGWGGFTLEQTIVRCKKQSSRKNLVGLGGLVAVPTHGIKNSLNVATCASIVTWEALRQWENLKKNARGI